jgi:hypothetical protein
MQISFENKHITNTYNIKFLGLIILSWKNHTDEPISKLNKVCYAIRAVKPLMSPEVLRMIYFSDCHSIISYTTNFWGNSSHSKIISKIQKRNFQFLRILAV